MARKFDDLRKGMLPQRLERNAEQAALLLSVMDLAELRGALHLTQEELANRLKTKKTAISRMSTNIRT